MRRSAAALALLLSAAAAAQDQLTVYRGARLWPGDGPPIDRAVLIVAQGRVQFVGGESTANPEGARVVDVAGAVITPGLVDAAWNAGVAPAEANEQGDEVTPALRVLDSVDPENKAFARARAAGVTTVHVMPGPRNVIGGLSAVLKTWAAVPAAMVVRTDAALRVVLGAEPSMGNRAIRGGAIDSVYYRRPTTRMGVIWTMRRSFYDAQEFLAESQVAEATHHSVAERRDLEVLARVLQGTLPVVTTARSEQDLRTALRLAAEFGFTPILDDAQEAHYVVDELKAARVWVMAGAPSADRVDGTAGADGAEPRHSTLLRLRAAGVPFVITTGGNALALDLVREAMFAHRFGLPAQEALAAVTALPARLLGIGDRTGTLAPGLDADFVVWTLDPFDPASVPRLVVVDGRETPLPGGS